MSRDRFIDLAYEQGEDGIFDLVLEDGDLAVTDGLESAILVSLFSDARADESEVGDPRKRRGWIGDLTADQPDDRFGSKLWLYDQVRLTAATATGYRGDAEHALEWLVEDELATYVTASVTTDPARRQIRFSATVNFSTGGSIEFAFALADATRTGVVARL